MKKLFFFLFFLVLSPVALAQSYSDYLQAAKRHLKNGNVEKARLTYNIYKDLTGKKDAYIEGQLNPAKAAKDPVASSSKTQASSASPAPQQDKHASSTSRTLPSMVCLSGWSMSRVAPSAWALMIPRLKMMSNQCTASP